MMWGTKANSQGTCTSQSVLEEYMGDAAEYKQQVLRGVSM